MENKLIEVFIQEVFRTGSIEIWVNQKKNDGSYNLHFDGDCVVYQKIEPGKLEEGLKPLVSLPYPIGRTFLKQLSIQTAGIGIKPENESRTEGKLEATEKHLEDMRMITAHLLKMPVMVKEEKK